MSLQGELIEETRKFIEQRENEQPLQVKEAVSFYCEAYRQKKETYAERHILNPQGLTFETYYKKQEKGELSETLAEFLIERLADCKMPFGIETIIAGTDERGAHIYVIENEDTRSETISGFAAIGAGREHAESQFRVARFSRQWFKVDTCLLTYIAKKRAEVIEGVGSKTDILTFYPNKKYEGVKQKGHEILNKEYVKLERQIKTNEKNARERFRKSANSAPTKETGIGDVEEI